MCVLFKKSNMIFYAIFCILDEDTGDGNGGDSERGEDFSNLGDDDAFGEVLSNSANNSFEDFEEEVQVSESYEETQERVAEAKRAQDKIAREKERQRRIRAARRSVGFVEDVDSEFDTTMNLGKDNNCTDHVSGDNDIYIFPNEGASRFVPRNLGLILRMSTATGSSGGAGSSAANKRKDRGSTTSINAQEDTRRIRPRPLTTSQIFPRSDWPLGMTAVMVNFFDFLPFIYFWL